MRSLPMRLDAGCRRSPAPSAANQRPTHGAPHRVLRSVARITPRKATTHAARRRRRRPPSTCPTPLPIQRPSAARRRRPIIPMSPSSASIATRLPRAASVPARHSRGQAEARPVSDQARGDRSRRRPRMRAKSPSCTGPATAPPPGRSRIAARITPAPIAAIPVSSRRRSAMQERPARPARGARARARRRTSGPALR